MRVCGCGWAVGCGVEIMCLRSFPPFRYPSIADMLREYFSQFGELSYVMVMRDKATGMSKYVVRGETGQSLRQKCWVIIRP